MTDPSVPVPIAITPNAARKVSALAAEEGDAALKLRIYISGGGCSGFQYNFAFDEEIGADDMVLDAHGATFVVDSMSLQMMAGAQIDYEEGLEGARFVIKNPNASATCGCGSSFSV